MSVMSTHTSSIAQPQLFQRYIIHYPYLYFPLEISPSKHWTDAHPPRIAAEWSCGVPERGTIPASSTLIFKPPNGSGDWTTTVSQRLARRFKTQIHLSLDVPQQMMDGPGSEKVVLEIEKQLVKDLQEHLSAQ
ncbi:hypothetical protein BT69DRAFT_1281178 [Atractiella rhizophila]|nr:hypothetical protein BT69DRAFT_1281178 [Atractiella rhizophila]